MSNIEKISIALPSEMVDAIKEAVDAGDYATTSEAVRDAVRDWRLKRRIEGMEIDELRQLVQEGIDSGPSLDGETVFAQLKARYAAMAETE